MPPRILRIEEKSARAVRSVRPTTVPSIGHPVEPIEGVRCPVPSLTNVKRSDDTCTDYCTCTRRCHEPTCTICSRTCNGCPPSVPPTPALTSSSSTPDTPLLSPQRPASALSVSMTNARQDQLGASAHVVAVAVAGRRRKVRELDQDDENAGIEGEDGGHDGSVDGVLPGCGRTVCQKCAFETPASDLTTCLDCAARYKGAD
ncbi:hypothetical protein BV20DRAFT_974224 [Pilatotrama ljubarskyi]|nr:hypothetical protein BV20DRAFT_974224 [Pilatotrama ljubarskyi]